MCLEWDLYPHYVFENSSEKLGVRLGMTLGKLMSHHCQAPLHKTSNLAVRRSNLI